MDLSLKNRIENQIFKFEADLSSKKENDSPFTLDYEAGRYRQNELAGLIRDSVPYFALTASEIESIDKSEWNKKSFTRISDANMNSKGDYGELLLFLILSTFYNVPKFVTKARLRSTTREQIKGFDCAHFSVKDKKITLWLGEAKFHKNISGAVSSAFSSITEHLSDPERIKSELKILGGEIEINKSINQDDYDQLAKYVSGGKSLDKIDIAVPVLITYDSVCIKNHCNTPSANIDCNEFKEELTKEFETHFLRIHNKNWPSQKNIKIVFFLLPLESVSELKKSIDSIETAMKF